MTNTNFLPCHVLQALHTANHMSIIIRRLCLNKDGLDISTDKFQHKNIKTFRSSYSLYFYISRPFSLTYSRTPRYGHPLNGWFPLSSKFSLRTHVKLTRVNEKETMYERPRVSVKVERGSTSCDLPFIFSILFTRVKFTCIRTQKLRDGGSPP